MCKWLSREEKQEREGYSSSQSLAIVGSRVCIDAQTKACPLRICHGVNPNRFKCLT